ncbi:MAG: hypothetical protein R3247_04455 [Rhodothermales bacterium]|nr:hypothetical protein [Rhodothermales bacterium]
MPSMLNRLKDRLKYLLERWLQRGALYQLSAVVGLIVLIAFGGGLLAFWLTDGLFADPWAAIWWSFLRLTDPGYLGDDEGTALRIISTTVTVLGYVLFMGSLIAILTQWLTQTMRRLESGLTPISMDDHIAILGYTNRTPTIIRELLLSEGRVQRFLRLHGTRRLRIVVLADEVDASLRQELRDYLGGSPAQGQIIFRSGSSLRIEHLRRVDFLNAAALILPGADFALGGDEATDARIIKTLMMITKYGAAAREEGEFPVVVAEIFDAQKAPIARQAFQGPLHLIAGDAFISRLIAQNVRHPGLSFVYGELLSYAYKNEIYVRPCTPELVGRPLGALPEAFPLALLLGVVRPTPDGAFQPYLLPAPDFRLEAEDRLVLIARDFEQTAPGSLKPAPLPPAPAPPQTLPPAETLLQPHRRLLFLGWSHTVLALLQEFSGYTSERFDIDLLSVVPAEEREAALAHLALDPEHVRVRHLVGDYTRRTDLERAEPEAYDNVILLSSDWLDTGEESDARTILGYLLLRALLPEETSRPEVLVELVDPANARLFRKRTGEVIISPVILSHILAHAALRPELTVIFEDLFGPGGPEIFFRAASDYGLDGRSVGFAEVQQAAARNGEVALGVRLYSSDGSLEGGVRLNPSRTAHWTLGPGDEVIVLVRYGE